MFTPRACVVCVAGLLAAGCESTPMVRSTPMFGGLFTRHEAALAVTRPSVQSPVVQSQFFLNPGAEIQWQAQVAQVQAGQVTSGKGMVGPDGTVVLGPYGTCKVGGLSLAKATTAVEEHLAEYMKTPTVRLSAILPGNQAVPTSRADLAWRSARMGSGETVIETANVSGVRPVAWGQTARMVEPAGTVVSEPEQHFGDGTLLRRVFSRLGLSPR
jgi:hypothetical protein